jgi:hypothetical protein
MQGRLGQKDGEAKTARQARHLGQSVAHGKALRDPGAIGPARREGLRCKNRGFAATDCIYLWELS